MSQEEFSSTFIHFMTLKKKKHCVTSVSSKIERQTLQMQSGWSLWQSFSQWECHTEGQGQTSMAIRSTSSMTAVYISLVENLKNFSVCSMKTIPRVSQITATFFEKTDTPVSFIPPYTKCLLTVQCISKLEQANTLKWDRQTD